LHIPKHRAGGSLAAALVEAVLADPSAIDIVEGSVYRLATSASTWLQRFLLPRRVTLDPNLSGLGGEVLTLHDLFAAAAALFTGPFPPGGEASGVDLAVGSVIEFLGDNTSTLAPALLHHPQFPLLVAFIADFPFFSVVILTIDA
jgi:hypothetical protein